MDLLDNPVWNALSTSHASIAEGNELAKRYPTDVSPLAAVHDQTARSYQSLAQLLGPGGTTELALVAVPEVPVGWSIARVVHHNILSSNSTTSLSFTTSLDRSERSEPRKTGDSCVHDASLTPTPSRMTGNICLYRIFQQQSGVEREGR